MKDQTDPRFAPILAKSGDAIDPLKLGAIEQAHRTGQPLTPEEQDARDAVLEHPMAALWLSRSALAYDAHLAEQVRIHGGEIVTETFRWGRRVERSVQRFPGTQAQQPKLEGEARPAVRRSSQRSCARSGDSGDDGPSDEPPQRRLCQNKRCEKDISHLGPKTWHCDNDGACKQQAYRDRRTAEHLDELVGTVAAVSCRCAPKGNLVVGGVCFACGRPRGLVTRAWLDDEGVPARSFVATAARTDNWRTRPDRKLAAKLRGTRGRWDEPERREVAAA